MRSAALTVLSALLLLAIASPDVAASGLRGAVSPADPDFARLIGDINSLVAHESRQPLLSKADAASAAAARGQVCAAINVLAALRNEIAAKTGKKEMTTALAGVLDSDALAVVADLKATPAAARCGGATVAPTSAAGPVVQVVSSDKNGLELRLTLPQAHFVSRVGGSRVFTDMAMDGLGLHNQVGAPNVPSFNTFFAVPMGADVSLQVLSASSYVLDRIDLWPEQEQPADDDRFGDKPFTIDARVYSMNSFFPASPARAGTLGQMRDLVVGGVEADGAQYNPARRSLRVFTAFDVRIAFAGKSTGVFGDTGLTSLWNLPFQDLYKQTLVNYQAVIGNLASLIRYLFCGEQVLVITTKALRPAADTLAAARSADGLDARVVEVGSGSGQIGTTNTQIQAYVRGQLTANCAKRPSYVILLGNTAGVPTFHVPTTYGVDWDGTMASDLPYALADDTDLFADVALGRIPAGDLATANTVVAKILGYEDSPPINFGFYGHATFTSYFQGAGPTDARGFTKTSETIRDALVASGYSVDRVYTDDNATVNPLYYYDGTAIPAALKKPGFAWNGTASNVVTDWNGGRFIVFHRDHGYPGGWNNPDFSTANIPSLTNGSLLPVVFSINCASGKFDDASPNFAEQVLQRSGGGAVGVIGDSRDSPSYTNNHLVLGLFDAVFPNVLSTYGSSTPITRMGDVLNAGKLYMDTQNGLDFQSATETQVDHYIYHWFGDPTMQIWTSQPLTFLIAIAKANLTSGQVSITFPQSNADGASLTLMQGEEAIGRALLENGQAVIIAEKPIDPDRLTALSVAFDKTGFEPASLSLLVSPPPPE